MSKYTTELRFICERNSGYSPQEVFNKTPDDIIDKSRTKIFDFYYPIFEENHRAELEHKIIRHYYTREISSETVGLWKLWLNSKMNEIMPKYNKLYKGEKLILDKELKNIDVVIDTTREDNLTRTDDFTRTDNLKTDSRNTRTDNLREDYDSTRTDDLTEETDFTRTDNLTNSSDVTKTDNLTEQNSHFDNDNRKFSDTPQGSITFNNVNNEYWLTDYTETQNNGGHTTTNTGTQRTAGTELNTGTQRTAGSKDNTGTQDFDSTKTNTGTVNDVGSVSNTGTQKNGGTVKNTGNQDTTTTESGYRGSKIYAELLEAYSSKVLNIDLMIIKELNDLFIKLW